MSGGRSGTWMRCRYVTVLELQVCDRVRAFALQVCDRIRAFALQVCDRVRACSWMQKTWRTDMIRFRVLMG